MKLKPYMGYSRYGGSEEGAMLIFAHSVKEAKKTAWDSSTFIHDVTDGQYIDLAVKYLPHEDYLFDEANQDKLKADLAHVIECPKTCKGCEQWGYELNEKGYCECCADNYSDESSKQSQEVK